ncbi:MAG: hypothetical protein H0W48_01235 [Methylibium sp.]|nr:hypothetical protein [Methylibium sp.]MBA3623096.1 hypothetical protein [Methylibium sp.]
MAAIIFSCIPCIAFVCMFIWPRVGAFGAGTACAAWSLSDCAKAPVERAAAAKIARRERIIISKFLASFAASEAYCLDAYQVRQLEAPLPRHHPPDLGAADGTITHAQLSLGNGMGSMLASVAKDADAVYQRGRPPAPELTSTSRTTTTAAVRVASRRNVTGRRLSLIFDFHLSSSKAVGVGEGGGGGQREARRAALSTAAPGAPQAHRPHVHSPPGAEHPALWARRIAAGVVQTAAS